MPSQYLIGLGHNASTFATPDPQPRSTTPMPGRRDITPGLTVYEQGNPHTDWNWDYLRPEAYNTILGYAGLLGGTPSAPVTIWTRDEDNSFIQRNATVVRPETQRDKRRDRGVWRSLRFVFLDLTATS